MKVFRTTFYVKPLGKARPRLSKRGVFTPQKQVNAEAEIRWLAKKENPEKHLKDVPLMARMTFQFKKPKTSKRQFPTVRPDLDNLIKSVADALNDMLYDDDQQIVRIYAEKIYGDQDQIDLEVFPVA